MLSRPEGAEQNPALGWQNVVDMHRRPVKAGTRLMNDVLSGFETAIKSLYPEDCDEIFQFAQGALSNAAAASSTFEESEFPQFVGKLNCVKDSSSSTPRSNWSKAVLSLGDSYRDAPAGQVCGGTQVSKGGFWGDERELRIIELGQHRLLFLRWGNDGKTTQIIWNGKSVAKVNKLVNGIRGKKWGGGIEIQNSTGSIISIHFPFILFSIVLKYRVRCIDEDVELLFPSTWPNPGGLPPKTISDFATIPFEKQMLIVASLLWSNL
jgi:hypothetical protein